MARPRSNRLLPLIAGIAVLMTVFILLRSCSDVSRHGMPMVMDRVPQTPSPDADTPAETIRTLTAEVASLTSEMKALRKENDALLTQNRAIEQTVAARVKRELREEQARGQPWDTGPSESVLSTLTARIDHLAGQVSVLDAERHAPISDLPGIPGDELPIGLGLEALPSGVVPVVWIEPLDGVPAGEQDPRRSALGFARRNSVLHDTREGVRATPDAMAGRSGLGPGPPPSVVKPRPVFTVPRNATLIGSTAMTALVGRIPVAGEVRDPMPFKVIVGAANLAANGIDVPGVEGMVWSGTAVGDWTLSCVTGRLRSVTFVFQDGTIRTLSGEDRELSLGWISDEQGIPCVSGERVTDAVSYLSRRIGTVALQAGADAAAQSETTTTVSGLTGAGTTSVTGDTGRFVLGKTVAGGAEEVRRWLDRRAASSFDAVFVRPGTRVAIHVDQQLDIDHAPEGRRISHVADAGVSHPARLD